MANRLLGCPHCHEEVLFETDVSGHLTDITFARQDGDRIMEQAGSITIEDYDGDSLRWQNCGETTSTSELVPLVEA